MKLQGVINADCKFDVNKHFQKHDYRADKKAQELTEYRKKEAVEANTTVGAVKRLIQKVSSLALNDNLLVRLEDKNGPLKTPMRR